MSLFHCLMAFCVMRQRMPICLSFSVFCVVKILIFLMLWNFMAICLGRAVCFFILFSWVSVDLTCEGLMLLFSTGKLDLIYFTISPIFSPLYLEHILVRSCNSWIRLFDLLCLSFSVPYFGELVDFNFKFLLYFKNYFQNHVYLSVLSYCFYFIASCSYLMNGICSFSKQLYQGTILHTIKFTQFKCTI